MRLMIVTSVIFWTRTRENGDFQWNVQANVEAYSASTYGCRNIRKVHVDILCEEEITVVVMVEVFVYVAAFDEP